MELQDLTCEHFSGLVGNIFQVQLEGGHDVSLELCEARKAAGTQSDIAFSIVFRGPKEPFLGQRMYDLSHPKLGTLPIFVVPIARDDGGISYEAVFTRLPND